MSDSKISAARRNAVRIMFIIYFCHDQEKSAQLSYLPDKDIYYIDSETKLQKIDFWIRYPDYLASALLRGCEEKILIASEAPKVKQTIRQIFQDDEPTLRSIPMNKFLRGAYEPLDDALGILTSKRLVYRRYMGERRYRARYSLTQNGVEAVQNLLQDYPMVVNWYAERCQLINQFFGHLTGTEMREHQYLEESYEQTQLSHSIPSIADEVRRRFERFFGEPL